jgi:hypothetical protein
MQTRFPIALLAASLLSTSFLSPANAQGPACPIAGISTTDFGTPPFDLTTLHLGWSQATCSLEVALVQDRCCVIVNMYLTRHFLIYGTALLPQPIPLPYPFFGHDLLVLPIDVLGPYDGKTSSISVPPDPALVGQKFLFQGIAEFITTTSFPIEPDYLLTHGVSGTLL